MQVVEAEACRHVSRPGLYAWSEAQMAPCQVVSDVGGQRVVREQSRAVA